MPPTSVEGPLHGAAGNVTTMVNNQPGFRLGGRNDELGALVRE